MNDCAGSVQLCALRIARLDASGVPSPGADNLYVTDNMISLKVDTVIKEGSEIQVANGCGVNIVDYKAPSSYRRLDVELALAVPDPELEELLAGGSVLTLGGDTVGYMMPALATAFSENGVSVEGWSKAIIGGKLATVKPYHRWVLPLVNNWRFGTRTLEDGSPELVLTGEGYANENWYDGPLNDWFDLTDVEMTSAMAHVRDTGIPEASCGYQVLSAS